MLTKRLFPSDKDKVNDEDHDDEDLDCAIKPIRVEQEISEEDEQLLTAVKQALANESADKKYGSAIMQVKHCTFSFTLT